MPPATARRLDDVARGARSLSAAPDAIAFHATADGAMRTAAFHLMTMPFTLRLRGASEGCLREAACAVRAELVEVDRVFSPFRADSLTAAFRRGDWGGLLASAAFREVYARCEQARDATGGAFDAWRDGTYDPVGLVKGWAVERAFGRILQPLLDEGRAAAAALSGGGDMQLGVAEGEAFRWGVGIEWPADAPVPVDAVPGFAGSAAGGPPGAIKSPSSAPAPRVLAGTVSVACGAVATSGTGKRGGHIAYAAGRPADPADDVAQATVVAPSLTEADVWATAAVSAGASRFSRIVSADAPVSAYLLVTRDGARRSAPSPEPSCTVSRFKAS